MVPLFAVADWLSLGGIEMVTDELAMPYLSLTGRAHPVFDPRNAEGTAEPVKAPVESTATPTLARSEVTVLDAVANDPLQFVALTRTVRSVSRTRYRSWLPE